MTVRCAIVVMVCAMGVAGCSSDVEEAIAPPTADARAVIDGAAMGFQDAFRREPGQRAVDRFADLLASEETGTSDVVNVLGSLATPEHGEIDLAVYRTSFPAWRDGDPNGSWSVRMCVTLVADGTIDAKVTVKRLTCPDIAADPPTIKVDATVDY